MYYFTVFLFFVSLSSNYILPCNGQTDANSSASFSADSGPGLSQEDQFAEALHRGDKDKVQEFLSAGIAGTNSANKLRLLSYFLYGFAKKGCIKPARVLIELGANTNTQDKDGYAILHFAAMAGDTDMTMLFLQSGANTNVQNYSAHWTPLHAAAFSDKAAIVKPLLDYGADINGPMKGGLTALHITADQGNVVTARLLLMLGAGCKVQAEDGCTPLHYAADKGHKEIVRLLLSSNASADLQDKKGMTPLHLAVRGRHTAVTELLLDSGVNSDVQIEMGATALHFAVVLGFIDEALLLLRAGADIDAPDNKGCTALWFALVPRKDTKMGNIKMVEILLNFSRPATVAPNIASNPIVIQVKQNRSALQQAQNFKAVSRLLNRGVYVYAERKAELNNNRRRLLKAAQRDDEVVVRYWLKQGFALNTCDKEGNTLWHQVMKYKSENVLYLLLSLFPDYSISVWDRKNQQGATPIEAGAIAGNYAFLKKVVDAINQRIPLSPVSIEAADKE